MIPSRGFSGMAGCARIVYSLCLVEGVFEGCVKVSPCASVYNSSGGSGCKATSVRFVTVCTSLCIWASRPKYVIPILIPLFGRMRELETTNVGVNCWL